MNNVYAVKSSCTEVISTRFPVYPEKLRKYARFMLRIRYILLFLLLIGPIVLFAGVELEPQSVFLMLTGTLLIAVGGMFFSTFHAHNVMIWVEIRDDGIFILDEKGEAYRSAEYRYVRNAEIRTFQVTVTSSEQTKQQYKPDSGLEVKVIMVYINAASCFDDLKLRQLGKRGRDVYWCDKVFHHQNCIAFIYDEAAWNLLRAQMTVHASIKL